MDENDKKEKDWYSNFDELLSMLSSELDFKIKLDSSKHIDSKKS